MRSSTKACSPKAVRARFSSLVRRLAYASRLISLGMGIANAKKRRLDFEIARAIEQFSENVIGFQRRLILNIAKHGGGQQRAGFREHVPGSIESRRRW